MTEPAEASVQMQFDDNLLLPLLFGERDQHLERIERQLGVSLVSRGNRLAISGPRSSTDAARTAIATLWDRLKRGLEVDAAAVDAAVRMASNGSGAAEATFRTRKRHISARSPTQAEYIRALREKEPRVRDRPGRHR